MKAAIRARSASPVGEEGLVIAIDSREQLPYRFRRSVIKTLASGDYSIVGLEDQVAIERKTKADAFNSLGRSRSRFLREIERLRDLDYAAIVIESTLPGFLTPPPFSRMSPHAAINTLLAWSVRYGVHVFFAGDRAHGNAVTGSILSKYWKEWRQLQERAHVG